MSRFLYHRDMTQPTLISLRNDALHVIVSDYGARLLSVKLHDHELLYGPKSIDTMLDDTCYCGAICGRVANRIAAGRAALSNGRVLQLPINNGANHLHGGVRSFADQLWSISSQSESELTLSLLSPDGDEGYTGNLRVQARYKLEGTSLSLQLEAVSDELTLVNLTHHAYWNLSASPDILATHQLRVSAEKYTPMVENIPTGEISKVENTPFDLRAGRALSANIGEGKTLPLGYDDNFCLQNSDVPQVSLSSGERRLELWTDAPAIQVYTGYYLPHPFGGVALEPQSYPDAPNKQQEGFPSIELQAGEVYRRQLRWSFY